MRDESNVSSARTRALHGITIADVVIVTIRIIKIIISTGIIIAISMAIPPSPLKNNPFRGRVEAL